MSIGKLFDLDGDKILPKADCYIIKPIKAVIDEYPDEYLLIIAYLHYMKSMRKDDNPYSDVPLDERSDQIVGDLGIKADVEDETIKQALQCVEEKYYTTFYGVYRGVKTILDKLGMKLMNEELDFSKKEGNSDSIKGWIKDYEQLRKSFKSAYKDFEEEQGDVKVRGGGDLAADEDHDY
jgi:hypothetical protein